MRDFTRKTITVLIAFAAIIIIFRFVTGITSIEQLLNLVISKTKKEHPSTKQLDIKKLINDNISITKFRSYPLALSGSDVNAMLKKYNFYSKQIDLNEEFCNPNGKGFDNNFVLQKKDKVVYDLNSGLMWQQSGSDESIKYADAKEYIKTLNAKKFAGFDDWRLPTLEEALSLMEPEQNQQELFIDSVFSYKPYIWTADQVQCVAGPGRQWVVYFFYGHCYHGLHFLMTYVRAVRSAQPF